MKGNSTRTTLFGILVTTSASLTTSELIALAKPLGISATNVKSHLTRMVADGALRGDGPRRRRRYSPSARQAHVVGAIVERLADTPAESWDESWYVLSMPMPSSRVARRALRADLWFDGFRPLSGGAFMRPTWPQPWAESRVRSYLRSAGAIAMRGHPDFVGVCGEDLYELGELDREATSLLRFIRRLRVEKHALAKAFAVRLKVGGRVARLVGHDPRLPPVVWGKRTGIQDLKRAFARFDARVSPLAQRFVDSVIGDSQGRTKIRPHVRGHSAQRR
jgi:DNA-binding transcriptional regulator PaaX